ncbi:MAG: 4Fe-4S binding protein [Kiritimatiellae bacterium]|nr:4Fe-4S binding protein [Kiritimatiellia bacterium]
MRTKKTILRIGIFALAAIISAQVIPWLSIAAAWPSVSPLLAVCAAAAACSVTLLSLVGLPLLVLALVRGRWFCRYLCPTGYLLILAGKLGCRHPASLRHMPNLGPGLCLLMLGSALAGFPLLLNLDPLAQFNGLFSIWRRANWTWINVLPGLSLIILGLVTAIWPQLWCARICPLGALQALLGMAGKSCRRIITRKPAVGTVQDCTNSLSAPSGEVVFRRRSFLALFFGAGLGWLLKRTIIPCPNSDGPIRPPGAVAEQIMQGLCARCGSCMRACPEGIILPDPGTGGPGSWLTPRLDFSRRYCSESCRACTVVCPTRAIRPLSLEAKRTLSLALAHVDRTICRSWNRTECLLCVGSCFYKAIDVVEENDAVRGPEVNKARCRGCGACQSNCPVRPFPAIVVHPRERSAQARVQQGP